MLYSQEEKISTLKKKKIVGKTVSFIQNLQAFLLENTKQNTSTKIEHISVNNNHN